MSLSPKLSLTCSSPLPNTPASSVANTPYSPTPGVGPTSLLQEALCERHNHPPLNEIPASGPETPGLEELKELLQRCWSHEPGERPSFQGELAIVPALATGEVGSGGGGGEKFYSPGIHCPSECQPETHNTFRSVQDKLDTAVSMVSARWLPQTRSQAIPVPAPLAPPVSATGEGISL